MAYTKQEWKNGKDGKTPMSADRFNHMEDGIAAAVTSVPAAPTADNLSGATTVGKSVMKAADAAAARTVLDVKFANLPDKPTIPSVSGLAKQSDLDAAITRIKALEDAATPPAEG